MNAASTPQRRAERPPSARLAQPLSITASATSTPPTSRGMIPSQRRQASLVASTGYQHRQRQTAPRALRRADAGRLARVAEQRTAAADTADTLEPRPTPKAQQERRQNHEPSSSRHARRSRFTTCSIGRRHLARTAGALRHRHSARGQHPKDPNPCDRRERPGRAKQQ